VINPDGTLVAPAAAQFSATATATATATSNLAPGPATAAFSPLPLFLPERRYADLLRAGALT
jgi:hypothetical protein